MTVIIHKNKSLKDIKTLSQEMGKVISSENTEELNLLTREVYIRDQLAANKKYEAWEPVTFYGYKTGIRVHATAALVSTTGKVAYDVDGELHVVSGDFAEEYPTVVIPVVKDIYDYPMGLSRIVASTFLSVPDKYKGIPQSELTVTHLDGQPHQCHFANLEWSLNKSKDEAELIEETVKAMNTPLPTEE